MSFPKAKVQRFNEIKSLTPSPADYNIKADKSRKYGTISQCGRFVESPSPAKSDSSANQSVTFRTPVLPKKRRALSFSVNKPINNEGVKEKGIEDSKKDSVIKKLNSQIEEFKQKIADLENDKTEVNLNQEIFQKEKLEFEERYKQLIENEQMKHVNKIGEINKEIMKISEEQKKIKEEYNELKNANRQELLDLLNKLNTVQELNHKIVEEYENKLNEQFNLTESKETELKVFQKQLLNLQETNEAKIQLIEENFRESNLLSEIQTNQQIKQIKENCDLKCKQQKEESEAILKECQEIGEHFVSEIEIEKNILKEKLDEKVLLNEKLQQQVDELVTKQNDVVHKELKLKQIELEKILMEKRTYEVTLSNSLETIEVLKKRLTNSDKDVLQLNEELSGCEEKIVELENKYDNIRNELQQKQTQNEELEMQFESSLTLYKTQIEGISKVFSNQIDGLKTEFIKKNQSQEYKIQTLNEVYKYLKEREKKNVERDQLYNQLVNEYEQLEEANQQLENKNEDLNKQLKEYESKKLEKEEEERVLQYIKEDKIKQIEMLQERCDSYQQQYECYKNKVTDMEQEAEESAEMRKKYIELSGKYDQLLNRYDGLQAENEKHKMMLAINEALIGPFREQLEGYESERNALLDEKRCMESEVKEIGLKYAQILGHQNHKQKIKHLVDLKETIHKLKEEYKESEAKVASYKKIVEKLKKDNADLKKTVRRLKPVNDDKENFNSSFNTSLNTSGLMDFPLRQRNN